MTARCLRHSRRPAPAAERLATGRDRQDALRWAPAKLRRRKMRHPSSVGSPRAAGVGRAPRRGPRPGRQREPNAPEAPSPKSPPWRRPPSPSPAATTPSWCLRGWLICKFAGLEFEAVKVPLDDAEARAELLLLSPSFLTPCLTYEGLKIWDTLAIAEFLREELPGSKLAAQGPRRTRPLPRHMRRDALRLRQSARRPADEPQGQPPGLQGLGRRTDRHRPRGGDLARAAGGVPVARSCSANLAWPTPCTPRSAPASSPTTWRWIVFAPRTGIDHLPAGNAGMEGRRPAGARRGRGAGGRVLTAVLTGFAPWPTTPPLLKRSCRSPAGAWPCRQARSSPCNAPPTRITSWAPSAPGPATRTWAATAPPTGWCCSST